MELLSIIAFGYILYFIITVVVFTLYYSGDKIIFDGMNFYGGEDGPDKVTLVENNEGLRARISLLGNARKSVDIIRFYINEDKTGTILEIADGGIKVRIVIDGKYYKISGFAKHYFYALLYHPNIEIRLYKTFKIFQPWIINNVLHDKLMIIDNTQAVISGRNIGDRYFFGQDKYVADLDTVITYEGNGENAYQNSVISQFHRYFQYMWENRNVSETKKNDKGQKYYCYLIDKLREYKKREPELFKNFDWLKKSVPSKKITLVNNPIMRFNKRPVVFGTVAGLFNEAKSSIFINSPYVVLNR